MLEYLKRIFTASFAALLWICSAGAELGAQTPPRNLPGFISVDRNSPVFRGHPLQKPRGDGIERRTPSRLLLEDFLEKDGRVRLGRISERITNVRQAEESAFLVFCQANSPSPALCRAGRSMLPVPLVERWQKHRLSISYGFVLEQLEKALQLAGQLPPLNTPEALNGWEAQDFYEALFQGLEAMAAMKGEDSQQGRRTEYYLGLRDLLKDVTLERRPEAVNLRVPEELKPEGRAFLSPPEIERLGLGLWELDPFDSGFWKKPGQPVRSYDTANYNRFTVGLVGEELLDPFRIIAVNFAGGSPGGTSPKCLVTYAGRRYKMKFRVRVAGPGQAGTLSDVDWKLRLESLRDPD